MDGLVIAGCMFSCSNFIFVRSFFPVKLNLSKDNIAGFEPTPNNDFIEVSDGNLDFVLSFSTPLFVTMYIMAFNSYIGYKMTREDDLILYCSLIQQCVQVPIVYFLTFASWSKPIIRNKVW